MTVDTVNAPPRSGPPRQAGRVTVPPVAQRYWAAIVRRCVTVPLVVLLPLVALAPGADHRFNIYSNGGQFAARPWRMFTVAVQSVPDFLRLGNFRPVGRVVEWSLDLVAFAITGLLGVPANISLRVVSFAGAIALTVAAVVFAESVTARGRLFTTQPSVLTAILPFAAGAGFVAAGRTSVTILFGGLYFLSAAVVLAVPALACRINRVGWVTGTLVVLAGATLAAFNELAYLAVPLASAAVLIRGRVVLGLSWRETWRTPGVRFSVLLWLGFLPVFVPIRVIIYRMCAHGGCYTGSDVALSGAAAAVPNRLVSWLPPLMWSRATVGTELHLAGLLPVLALLALSMLAIPAVRAVPRLAVLDRRQLLGLAAVAAFALLFGAMLAALNADLQALSRRGVWGQGWRETGLTTAVGAILLTVLAAGRRRWAAAALVPLVAVASVSAAANKSFRDGGASAVNPFLHDRIAQEIADFDRTPAGELRRCTLRAEFIASSITNHDGVSKPELERIDVSLNRASRQLAGRPFCTRPSR